MSQTRKLRHIPDEHIWLKHRRPMGPTIPVQGRGQPIGILTGDGLSSSRAPCPWPLLPNGQPNPLYMAALRPQKPMQIISTEDQLRIELHESVSDIRIGETPIGSFTIVADD